MCRAIEAARGGRRVIKRQPRPTMESAKAGMGLTGSDVVPVGVVRSQLLERTGLDGVDPVGDFQLSGSLQVRRVGSDERISTVTGR